MAQQTTPNLNLVLPYQSENVEVNDINDNYTKIDTGYGNLSDQMENFKKTYAGSASFDTITEPGIHYINGTNGKWGTLYVSANGSDINQTFIQNDGKLVQSRRQSSGTWSSWVELALDKSKGFFLIEGVSWSNNVGWGRLQSFIPHTNANNLTISNVTCVTYKGNSDYTTTIEVHTKSADGFCVRTTDTSVAGYPFRIEFTAS